MFLPAYVPLLVPSLRVRSVLCLWVPDPTRMFLTGVPCSVLYSLTLVQSHRPRRVPTWGEKTNGAEVGCPRPPLGRDPKALSSLCSVYWVLSTPYVNK